MAIKNYTTTVEVHKSLGEIQGALAGHGARKIMVDYDGAGQPVGITFGIETPDGPRGFLLPANVAGVKAVFARQKVRAPEGQAERTAIQRNTCAAGATLNCTKRMWPGGTDTSGSASRSASGASTGRKLWRLTMTDEAVEMVVRRLEALHEISPST